MPLSDFLDKINPLEKRRGTELYLSLVVSENKVKSGIWTLDPSSGEGKILSFGSVENWEGKTAEELIVVADTSIATAVSKLPEVSESQPEKTILGLPENWVENESILKDKLKIIHDACKKLLLKPVGFVVTPEAITHFLKKEEGGLPSIILVALEESEIAVSLIVQGKFIGSKIVGRSNNIALDLEEGLLRFNYQENLPTRILLLDGDSFGEAKQTLISYPWTNPIDSKKIKFTQLPKVESVPITFEISAVILAGSQELKKGSYIKNEQEKIIPKEEPVMENKGSIQEEPESLVNSEIPEEDFGFLKSKDVQKQIKLNEQENEIVVEENIMPVQVITPPSQIVKKQEKTKIFKIIWIKIKKFFSLFKILQLILNKKLLFILLGILGILGLFFAAFFTLVKAEVRIYVHPQIIDKQFSFTVSSKTSSVDAEKMVLPAREITADVSGNKTADVNGKKTIGEKAKGEIIVYNKTDQIKTLSKGSIIKGPAGLKFTLNEEIKIASKSSIPNEKGEVITWGEAKGQITAFDIGTQYNIEANSQLTFENIALTILLAKNPSAFSGGTSREVKAVSKEDKDNLQKSLGSDLTQKAKDEIKAKISPSDQFLLDSLQVKSRTDKYNHEVGDEADSLSLEEKLQVSGLYLKGEDFNILVEKIVSPLITEGYARDSSKETKSFEEKDKAKGEYLAKVLIKALPQFDIQKVEKDLKLKTVSQTINYVKNLKETSRVDISISPTVFSKLGILPLKEQNILILIGTE